MNRRTGAAQWKGISTMLTESNVEQIISAVSTNAAALTESFAQCFDVPWNLVAGESGPWIADDSSETLSRPGLAVVFEFAGDGFVVLIPDHLPLPGWYATPNDSQKSRLETLAMEWSMNLFPPDLEPGRYATVKVPRLRDYVNECQPADWAATIAIPVDNENGESLGTLQVVWPLTRPRFEAEETTIPDTPPAANSAATSSTTASTPSLLIDPLVRLRTLPVQVSVRLAEKKITVSQLLGISSGTLISFPKSCEAQLDLYVNNARYCRGEAVKIGENFGLKINEVGTTEERATKILNG